MSSDDANEVRRIVLNGLKGYRARVFLFGSWAKGDAGRTSDIDVAVLPLEPLPAGVWGEISDALENSNVLYSVDLVDLSTVNRQFRNVVETEGILWNG